MSELWAAYMTAFTLGAAHALEVDHMVAVTAFVGNTPRVLAAATYGLRWGLGHAAAVLLVGGTLAWFGVAVPPSFLAWAEFGVGAMLIGLGAWAWRNARRLHVHDPATHGDSADHHAHLHAHDPASHPHHHRHAAPERRHRHLSTFVGAAHGLAGTAPVLALVPVTLVGGFRPAVGYLAVFGMGTVLAMGVYAAIAALALGAATAVGTARGIARTTALLSASVGIMWIVTGVRAL